LSQVLFSVPDKPDPQGFFAAAVHAFATEYAFRINHQSFPLIQVIRDGDIDQAYGFTPATIVAGICIDNRDQPGPGGSNGREGSHGTQILTGPSFFKQKPQEHCSDCVKDPDMLIMGI